MPATCTYTIAALGRFVRVGPLGGILALLLTACAGSPDAPSAELAAIGTPGPAGAPGQPATRAELQQAIQRSATAFAKNPADPQAALAYAQHLRGGGEKQQALAVLQQASSLNPGHRGINSEYGRLALELEQVGLAQKVLEQADDPANPDWRVISARGTALAKQGKYRDAIPFYERALVLAPNQSSVLNNLALARAMEGDAEKSETLLKRAVASGGHEGQVAQNLALVLSLQGKYDEAKLTGARLLSPDQAAANVDYMRRIVQLDPKPLVPSTGAKSARSLAARSDARSSRSEEGGDEQAPETSAGWTTQVAQVKPSR